MKYQVLSRRYRPKTFEEVIGQQSIVKLLKNSLSSKKIPHAFLFTGIRGTGKTTTARILSRALNCEKGVVTNPCNECSTCKQLLEGRNMDVFEIDGASNTSVNDVRTLKENTRFLPTQSRYKIYIIDEVHMLSTEAFNALLKTLEEPPDYVVFILATTEPQKIPETVLSRCVRLNFRRVETKEIVNYLEKVLAEEKIGYEESALFVIARRSEGSVRDALSFLELVLAYGGGVVREEDVNTVLGLLSRNKIFDVLKYFANKDITSILNFLEELKKEGADLFSFLEYLIYYLRHLVLYAFKIPFDTREFSGAEITALTEIFDSFSKEELTVYYQGVRQILEQIRFSTYPQYDVELGLVKLVALKDFLESSPTFPTKAAKKNDARPLPLVESEGIHHEVSPPLLSKNVEEKDVLSFINYLKSKKPFVTAHMEHAKCTFADGVFSITYLQSQKVFYEHIMKEEESRELKQLLKDFYGYDIILEVNLEEDINTAGNPSNPLLMENDVINLIMTEFSGAKIVTVKEQKKGSNDYKKDEDFEENGGESDE